MPADLDPRPSRPSGAELQVEVRTGASIAPVLPDLARLRIEVFRDWPYLYDGSLEYEQDYLDTFAAAAGAVVVSVHDGERMVGASTGCPMPECDEEFSRPFRAAGWDLATVFYCGESVLLRPYRGRGLGRRFFDEREAHARRLGGLRHSAFCGVVRPPEHPLRPPRARPLDAFWRRRGYAPIEGMIASYDWKDVDQPAETPHPMQFWSKAL